MAITGIEQPSSRQVTKQATGNRVIIRRFSYDRGYDYESEMPTVGDYDATYGYFRGYSSQLAPGYLIVELTYDTEGTIVNFAPGAGDTEYWAQTTAEETPIEYHADYKVRWNYGLYGANDGKARTTADYPGGDAAYLTSSNQAALEGNTELKWFHDDPGVEWVKIKRPSKGVDFYLRPSRTVFRRDYFRPQASAEAALVAVGTLVTPAETFGATGGSWLVTSSNTQYDGRYWVTETTYQHSGTGWDTDIY